MRILNIGQNVKKMEGRIVEYRFKFGFLLLRYIYITSLIKRERKSLSSHPIINIVLFPRSIESSRSAEYFVHKKISNYRLSENWFALLSRVNSAMINRITNHYLIRSRLSIERKEGKKMWPCARLKWRKRVLFDS